MIEVKMMFKDQAELLAFFGGRAVPGTVAGSDAQAKVEKAAKVAAEHKPAGVSAPEKSAAADAGTPVTLQALQAQVSKLALKNRPAAVAIATEMGVAKFSELTADRYADALAKVTAALEV